MSIKRYISTKDNTISTAFKENLRTRASLSNMGASDILEFFTIYGQADDSSLEQARILIEFPVSKIKSDRDSGALKVKGSDKFVVKLYNAPHNQTTPMQYTVSISPLVKAWEEGRGLDMESYTDLDASNWLSSSEGVSWTNQGGDFASLGHIADSSSPVEFTTYVNTQSEDIEVEITALVEDWLTYLDGKSTRSGAHINFNSVPAVDELILLYSHEGTPKTFQFKNGTEGTADNNLFFVSRSMDAVDPINKTAASLIKQINNAFSGHLTASASPLDATVVNLSQSVTGYFGNTIISSSNPSEYDFMPTALTGGLGAPNYGVVVRLSGSAEAGTNSESYYTKKIFSRTSQYFFRRPCIEAQFDKSVSDDRTFAYRSSSLAPEADNLNRIYLYNKQRSGLIDIPNTGSQLLVELVPSVGSSAVTLPIGGGVDEANRTFITASKHSDGIYEAEFSYDGQLTSLIDIWQSTASLGISHLHTGSGVTVVSDSVESHYEIDNYSVNISNLKPSYGSNERVNLRVYTRNKTLAPNIYTVASVNAPVSPMRNSFYQITRVADNHVVIPYTTGSGEQYSKLSYDMSGSFFELDMSLLEPNYSYEIRLLRQDGVSYVEQQERFRFRIDP